MTTQQQEAQPTSTGQPELRIIGDDGSHDALRAVLSTRKPGKILDIPCGHGVLSKFLLDLGWDVHCADIDRGNLELKDVPFFEVNLNRELDIESESFDAIVCANGLHRLFNPGAAIGEFARILRPGGRLYVNVNNYASIDRRIRFLLSGSINDMINRQDCRQTIADPEAHVRVPLLYPQLASLLDSAGFETVDLRRSAVRTKHRLLWPVAWVVRFAALFLPRDARERWHVKTTLSTPIMPGGGYFFLEAVKRDG